MTLVSVFSHMGRANSNISAGLFYSTKLNERACVGDKAEALSALPSLIWAPAGSWGSTTGSVLCRRLQ